MTDYLPECDDCGMPMRDYIAGTGICTPCHDARYGKGHRPYATLVPGSTAPMWTVACLLPGCEVVDRGPTSTDRDEMAEAARTLHEAAQHGPAA